MAAQITNYKCPACTGPLRFDGASGRLVCDYCGSSYSAEEIEKLYQESNASAAAAQQAAEEKEAQAAQQAAEAAGAAAAEESAAASGGSTAAASAAAEAAFAQDTYADGSPKPTHTNTENAGDGWGKDAQHMRAYSCTSCGAELVCDDTTAATSCPYCGNATIIPGQFAMERPDYVIPFAVDRKQAVAALKNYYSGKFLLPRSFSESNHIEKIQGVYVPFWMFNGDVDAEMTFDAANSTQRQDRDGVVTHTKYYQLDRSGVIHFEKIPVDASTTMPDALMDSIEPYDYTGLKPFSMSYLPGFLANKYDVPEKDCVGRADDRAANSAVSAIESTITGYQEVQVRSKKIRIDHSRTEYALLPVWILSTQWNGQNFLFAMNGQTGNFTGDLPVSGAKLSGLFVLLTVIFSLIGMLIFGS